MNIAAYCRVSTDKEEQISSLKNQYDFFKDFADKNGHTLVNIYSDEGVSGKQLSRRTGFIKMLEDAEKHLFDMLVVKDISRFARNTVDFLTSIRKLKSLGIETYFISVNQTILCGSEFMLTIFSALAQEESANLSTRIKFGKHQSAVKGKVPNYVYGYKRIDKYTLEINEDEAKIVRKIFSLYCKGHGSRKIANTLTNEKIPTAKGFSVWSPKTIRRILSNPIYNGILISRKTETTDFITGTRAPVKNKEEYTFVKENLKIIDDKTFRKANKIHNSRRVNVNLRRNSRPHSIKCEDS